MLNAARASRPNLAQNFQEKYSNTVTLIHPHLCIPHSSRVVAEEENAGSVWRAEIGAVRVRILRDLRLRARIGAV